MSILFIVERFHDSGTAFDSAERMAGRGEEVVILFILEGVEHAVDEGLVGRLGFAKSVNCLNTDGKREVAPGVNVVDFEGWVKLIEESDRIASWF